MTRPISIQEFADSHKSDYGLIKETVRVYEDWLHYNQSKICAICDKELAEDERLCVSPGQYHVTCNEHRSYADRKIIFQIRENLGYSPFRQFLLTP
jgi:hypothetical protein